MVDAPARGYRLDFDPGLVEEAVLLAVAAAPRPLGRRFREERDPIYEIADEERREAAFGVLHGRWLTELGLAAAVRGAVESEPAVLAGTRRCLVLKTASSRREYADLRGGPSSGGESRQGPPVLAVSLRAETLADPRLLRSFLERELIFVADLLDPAFGFRADLDPAGDRRGLGSLILQRYRLLWETTVDGRLAARGRLAPAAEEERRRRFLAAFAPLGAAAHAAFERFFRSPRPSHAELVAYAREPRGDGASGSGRECPLCGMPSYHLHPDPAALDHRVLAEIRRRVPDWNPGLGLCRQCADLYAARAGRGRPGGTAAAGE